MADFTPFSLANVFQNVEAVKGMRNDNLMAGLQQKFMGQQMDRAGAQEQRAAAQESRAQAQFDQEAQLFNTRLLNMAAAEVAQNPNAARRWDSVLKAAIPNWEPVQGDPAQIQAAAKQIYESTSAALSAYQGQQQGQTKFGVTPQYGVDQSGNPVPIQFNDRGEAVTSRMPEGVTISRTPIRMDLGTEWAILDPVTRQVVGREPKNIAAANAEEKIGDWVGESYAEMQKTGMSAGQTLARLDRLEALSKQIDTGRLAGAKKAISEYAQALGVDVEGLDEMQAFQALTNQVALEMRNPSGGAGMPGAMSDADREFLLRTVPNLQNTPGGNKLIIDYARKVAQRNQQVAARAREYKRRTGRMDEGFFDELASWSAQTPMFNESASALPQGVTEADIEETMRANNMTRDQVLEAIRAR